MIGITLLQFLCRGTEAVETMRTSTWLHRSDSALSSCTQGGYGSATSCSGATRFTPPRLPALKLQAPYQYEIYAIGILLKSSVQGKNMLLKLRAKSHEKMFNIIGHQRKRPKARSDPMSYLLGWLDSDNNKCTGTGALIHCCRT